MTTAMLRQNIMLLQELVKQYQTSTNKETIRNHIAYLTAIVQKSIDEEKHATSK